jgi:uncharacterized protein (DUF2141 family)
MTRVAKLYLRCDQDPTAYHATIKANGRLELQFADIAPGDYALAILHDENGNGKVDTNFIGIPKEGVGFSNNATGKMGPPSFDAVRFHVGSGGNAQMVKIKYLL